ncbi:MAG: prephenate dehydrogenase [Eubacteriales bacterium]
MTVGVVGLGLIGGSLAKAIKKYTEHTVMGWDASEVTRASAKLLTAVDGFMEDGNPKDCDLVIIALYPSATIIYIEENQAFFKKDSMVVDCAGVKQEICKKIEPIAKEQGFTFCGGHPMAGIERSGFTYSTPDLFQGASMILTPYGDTSIGALNDLSVFLKSLGFGRMQVSTPAEHDEMIAYTSQLAHVVSSAYVRSELSSKFKGFSAGSFKDMTRVAKLNENMWTELFLDNSEYLADEIDELAKRLLEYSRAIREHNDDELKELLKEGKEIRLAIDESKEFE